MAAISCQIHPARAITTLPTASQPTRTHHTTKTSLLVTMAFALKIASAFLAVACAVQAAPLLGQPCLEGACHQTANSGSVALGSTTKIVPLTQVTPITRYQPIVQAYAPIVQSQCGDYPAHLYGGFPNMAGRLHKRDVAMEPNTGAACTPTQMCEKTIPASTIETGSLVKAKPSSVILPSTVYQGHVVSEAAEIEAAAAQHTELSRGRVNLGSNTHIQPVTKIMPSTVYQPSVAQKATMIEAAPQQDLSLAQSSASLGSMVTVRPTTTVEPLTVFQPKVKSLPFIISDEGCF